MAVKAYYLDKRVTKTPTVDGSLADLQNVLNLKTYIQDVVDSSDITFDTVVLEDGTAALPSLTNDGDLNTGLYFPSADNLGLTTGGTQRVNVSSAGAQVTGALTTTTSVDATTSVSIGTNVTLAKEVNHGVTVTTTTTAATAGGNLSIAAGQGATSGNGGNGTLASGAGGLTGAGGIVALTSGAGGATSGASGAVNIASGAATVGSSGTITVTSGNTASGVAGDVVLTTGTHTSTTVSPMISLNKAVVRKPNSSSVASGATITGVELVGGLITATGATGNWQLPATADITTAIGSTPAGTNFEFVFNAAGMTATNTATLVVGANMTVSTPVITGGATLTVAQDANVTGGFRVVFDTPTTCKLYRIW